MSEKKRITLYLSSELVREAKHIAVDRDVPLSQLAEAGLKYIVKNYRHRRPEERKEKGELNERG
ncbi:MAG: type II toxin-antitoxin system CcdA family antitoxin [Thermoproteota archaeon]